MSTTAHELKTDPAVFQAVWTGDKTHEIRFNDRNFQIGDRLILRETHGSGEQMKSGADLLYTGRQVEKIVSHVLSGYGLMPGWVILSFAAQLAAPVAPAEARCKSCGGNDADMRCAYPGEGRPGCLRDARLAGELKQEPKESDEHE